MGPGGGGRGAVAGHRPPGVSAPVAASALGGRDRRRTAGPAPGCRGWVPLWKTFDKLVASDQVLREGVPGGAVTLQPRTTARPRRARRGLPRRAAVPHAAAPNRHCGSPCAPWTSARLSASRRELHSAWQEAVQTDSTVPMHTFLQRWGVFVALRRYPGQARRLHELEAAVAEAPSIEDARRAPAEIGVLLDAARREGRPGREDHGPGGPRRSNCGPRGSARRGPRPFPPRSGTPTHAPQANPCRRSARGWRGGGSPPRSGPRPSSSGCGSGSRRAGWPGRGRRR